METFVLSPKPPYDIKISNLIWRIIPLENLSRTFTAMACGGEL
jgi:hypothetical protein